MTRIGLRISMRILIGAIVGSLLAGLYLLASIGIAKFIYPSLWLLHMLPLYWILFFSPIVINILLGFPYWCPACHSSNIICYKRRYLDAIRFERWLQGRIFFTLEKATVGPTKIYCYDCSYDSAEEPEYEQNKILLF